MPDRAHRRRVLVVDDEESIRTFVERVLEDAGYQTCVAVDGASALALIQTEPPFDLVLTDLNMPEMPGDELVRRVRLLHPDVPVLYLTGFADRLFTARSTLWENESFVEKPISMKGLCEAVSLALFGTIKQS